MSQLHAKTLEGRFKVGIKILLMAMCAIRDQHLWEQQLKLWSKCLLLEYIIPVYTSLTICNNIWSHKGTVPYSADCSTKNHYFTQLLNRTKPQSLRSTFSLNSAWTKHQIFKMFNGIWNEKESWRREGKKVKAGKWQLKTHEAPPWGFLGFSLIGIGKALF